MLQIFIANSVASSRCSQMQLSFCMQQPTLALVNLVPEKNLQDVPFLINPLAMSERLRYWAWRFISFVTLLVANCGPRFQNTTEQRIELHWSPRWQHHPEELVLSFDPESFSGRSSRKEDKRARFLADAHAADACRAGQKTRRLFLVLFVPASHFLGWSPETFQAGSVFHELNCFTTLHHRTKHVVSNVTQRERVVELSTTRDQ